MVGIAHSPDNYFDFSQLTAEQRALLLPVLTDLLRSPTFAAMAEKSLQHYGRVRISMDLSERTASDVMSNPPRMNINPVEIEQSGYKLPGGEVRPVTLHRVVAHEVAHFAQDKDELKALVKRRLAGIVQTAMLYGASPEALATGIQRRQPHFLTFFGSPDALTLVRELASLPAPIDQIEYVQLTEPRAMQADNVVMRELYGETERTATARAYTANVMTRDRGFRCALGTITIVEESHPGETEPCAYGRIPGRQGSLIPGL